MAISSRIVVAVFCLLIAKTLGADVVELKNGERVEGTFKQASPSAVSIEVGGQTISFKVDQVRAIYFGSAPPPATPPPQMNTATGAREALEALRAVRSVTRAGITFDQYSVRVADLNVIVDRYLRQEKAGPERDAIAKGTRLYTLAAKVWGGAPSQNVPYREVGSDPDAESCAPLQAAIAPHYADRERDLKSTFKTVTPADVKGAVMILGTAQVVWICAADEVAKAERLLGSR